MDITGKTDFEVMRDQLYVGFVVRGITKGLSKEEYMLLEEFLRKVLEGRHGDAQSNDS